MNSRQVTPQGNRQEQAHEVSQCTARHKKLGWPFPRCSHQPQICTLCPWHQTVTDPFPLEAEPTLSGPRWFPSNYSESHLDTIRNQVMGFEPDYQSLYLLPNPVSSPAQRNWLFGSNDRQHGPYLIVSLQQPQPVCSPVDTDRASVLRISVQFCENAYGLRWD